MSASCCTAMVAGSAAADGDLSPLQPSPSVEPTSPVSPGATLRVQPGDEEGAATRLVDRYKVCWQCQDTYGDWWIRWIDYADDANQTIEDAWLAKQTSVEVPGKMYVNGERVMWEISLVPPFTQRNCHNHTTRFVRRCLISHGDLPDKKSDNQQKADFESSTVACAGFALQTQTASTTVCKGDSPRNDSAEES